MHCIYCGAALQPGITTCPTCGKPASANTSGSSPHEYNADAAAYVEYSSASKSSSATPGLQPQENFPEPFVGQHQAGEYSAPSLATTPLPLHGGPPHQPQRLSTGIIVLLTMLALLVVGEGGVITYFTAVLQPAQLHTQATAVVKTLLTTQAQHAFATATAASPQITYNDATRGKPALDDMLGFQDANLWAEGNLSNGSSCAFSGGAYHVNVPRVGVYQYCPSSSGNFSNFAYQVQLTFVKGDLGGLLFRYNSSSQDTYAFIIDALGHYALYLFTSSGIYNGQVLRSGSSLEFITGLGRPNLLTIVARGNDIYMYVNKHFIAKVSDSAYSSGEIGVVAASFSGPTDVAFNNAKVWNL
jgi:hypothetical protein